MEVGRAGRCDSSVLLREGEANHFRVVADEDALVGVGGVGPDDAALPEVGPVGFDDVGPVDLLVAVDGESGDGEVALFGEEEVAVLVRGDEDCSPPGRSVEGDGFEGLPDPLAGEGFHAAELSVAAGPEEVAIPEDHGVHDAVEMGGLPLAGLVGAVDDVGGAVVLLQAEEQGAVVERGEEEVLLVDHLGHGNGEAKANLPRDGPEAFPGGRIEGVDALGMPDDEQVATRMFHDAGRAVARLPCAQGTPDLLAGLLVEGDRGGTIPGGEADEEIPVDEGRSGKSPGLGPGLEAFLEVVLPEFPAVLGRPADEEALGAEGVDPLSLHEGSDAGAGRVGHGVGAVIGFLPHDLPAGGLEAEEAFLSRLGPGTGGFALGVRAAVDFAVHEVDSFAGHCRTGVAPSDGRAPKHLGSTLGKFVEDSRFAPDAIMPGAEPLGPVISGGGEARGDKEEANESHGGLQVTGFRALCHYPMAGRIDYVTLHPAQRFHGRNQQKQEAPDRAVTRR